MHRQRLIELRRVLKAVPPERMPEGFDLVFAANMVFFGLSHSETAYLFHPGSYGTQKTTTIKDVADHITTLLEMNHAEGKTFRA